MESSDGLGMEGRKALNPRHDQDTLQPAMIPRQILRRHVPLGHFTHSLRKRILGTAEVSILILWFALQATAAARLHGPLMPRPASRRLCQSSEATSGSRSSLNHPDFTGWSPKRVAAYEESLTRKTDAPIAVVRIPRIHLEVPVYEGTDDLTLNRGAGHIAGTAPPGSDGNVGISGHRDGFFRGLKDIAAGDSINLAEQGETETYVVDRIEIVTPRDVQVLRDRGIPSLTLTTCYPFFFIGDAPKRYIVHAHLTRKTMRYHAADASPGQTP